MDVLRAVEHAETCVRRCPIVAMRRLRSPLTQLRDNVVVCTEGQWAAERVLRLEPLTPAPTRRASSARAQWLLPPLAGLVWAGVQ